MVRDVGQRGKWGSTGRLTANFSLLATPDGAANGRRTNAVMPNGHHSLPMPPHGPIFPYSLRFPHHPTVFHTLPGALWLISTPAIASVSVMISYSPNYGRMYYSAKKDISGV